MTFLVVESVTGCPCPGSRRRWPAKPGGRERRHLRVSGGHGCPERTAGERAWATPKRAQASVNYWMLPVVTRKSLTPVSPDCLMCPAIGFRFVWFGGPVPGSPRREPRECGVVSGEVTRIPSACASGFPAAAVGRPHRQRRRFSGAERIGHDFTACWLVRRRWKSGPSRQPC